MKNGSYNLAIAPQEYPGLKYRGRYCQEHWLVWWLNTGTIPKQGEEIHHKNGIKTDNSFKNLELKQKGVHQAEHNIERGQSLVRLRCPKCSKVFILRKGQTHIIESAHKARSFCSRRCAARFKGPSGPIEGNVIEEFRTRA